jgi:1-acyl-sn-glycerol-3-phosphate acyltransferase
LPRAVIAANHASFLDGLLLGAFLPGDPIFAVDTYIAKECWAKPFLAVVNDLPVDPANPLSIRAMIRAVERGCVQSLPTYLSADHDPLYRRSCDEVDDSIVLRVKTPNCK